MRSRVVDDGVPRGIDGSGIRWRLPHDGVGEPGEAVMGGVHEDGGTDDVQFAHPVVQVFRPDPTVVPGGAVTVVEGRLGAPLGTLFRDGCEP